MKLWIKNSIRTQDDHIWYINGRYFGADQYGHTGFVAKFPLKFGLTDEWKRELMNKFNIKRWSHLQGYETKDGDWIDPIEETEGLETYIYDSAENNGAIRLWYNSGDFEIECDNFLNRKSDVLKILNDDGWSQSVVLYETSLRITVSGNTQDVIDVLNGKSSDARIYKYDYDAKQYKYYSTLREVLK